jgi:tetratricopeptide (TPR) repeat protein
LEARFFITGKLPWSFGSSMGSILDGIKRWIVGPRRIQSPQHTIHSWFQIQLPKFSELIDPAYEYAEAQEYVRAEQACRAVISYLAGIAEERDDDDARKLLGLGYLDLGAVHRILRRTADAERFYAAAIAMFESLAKSDSQARFANSQLAACQNHLGLLYMDCGPVDKAVDALENTMTQRRHLVNQFPDDLENQVYLAGTICNRAHIARESGENDLAMAYYDESLQIIDRAIPPCDCGCRDAIVGAISLASGHPHWILTAHEYRRNAEAGRLISMRATSN